MRSYISWTLGANVERLELRGSAVNGAGNALNNTLVGNSNDNLLNGGVGRDYMVGGAGDDIFIATAADWTIEAAGQGRDTVRAAVGRTLGANVARLELQGAGNPNGAGNTLNNTLVGNSGNNLLNGGAGNDYMVGGAGNDTFVVAAAGWTIETANGGTDRVRSYINWTLGTNVERLELQGASDLNGGGNSLNNTLVGNSGDNLLRAPPETMFSISTSLPRARRDLRLAIPSVAVSAMAWI